MRTVFVILSILAVAFAVFEDDTPLLKEGLEQQGADPSLDELQHDVQALQDQVNELKQNLADGDEAATEVTDSSEELKKEKEKAVQELQDDQDKLDTQIADTSARVRARQDDEAQPIVVKKQELQSVTAKVEELKEQLLTNREEAAAREAQEKARFEEMQTKSESDRKRLRELQEGAPARAAQLEALTDEQAELETQEKAMEEKTQQEKDATDALGQDAQEKKKELDAVYDSLGKAQAEKKKSQLELNELKGEEAEKEEEESGAKWARTTLTVLQNTLAEQQERLTSMEEQRTAVRQGGALEEAQLQTAAQKAEARQAEEQELMKPGDGNEDKVAMAEELAAAKIQKIQTDADNEVKKIEEELKAARKEHAEALTETLLAVARQKGQNNATVMVSAEEMKAKIRLEWSNKISQATKTGRGDEVANEEIERVLEEAHAMLNHTKAQQRDVEAGTNITVRKIKEDVAVQVAEAKAACEQKIKTFANRSQAELEQEEAMAEAYRARIGTEEAKLNSTDARAQQSEEAQIASAAQEDAQAINAAKNEAEAYAAQQASAKKAEEASWLKKLEQLVEQKASLNAEQKVLLLKQRNETAQMKANSQARSEVLEDLNQELKNATSSMHKAAYAVVYPTQHVQSLEEHNRGLAAKLHKMEVQGLALAGQLSGLAQEVNQSEASVQKAEVYNAALQAHEDALQTQLHLVEASRSAVQKHSALQEAAAGAVAVRVKRVAESAQAALITLGKKSEELAQRTEQAVAATEQAEAEPETEPEAEPEDAPEAEAEATAEAAEVGNAQPEESPTLQSAGAQLELLEESTSDNKPDWQTTAKVGIMARCAKMCLSHSGAGQPACMHSCMEEMDKTAHEESQLGEAEEEMEQEGEKHKMLRCAQQCFHSMDRAGCMALCQHSAAPAAPTQLGEADSTMKHMAAQQQEEERIARIARHCQYQEDAMDLASRRAQQRSLRELNQAESEAAESLLQEGASGATAKKRSTWFKPIKQQDGGTNYDNTSMECSCIRGCAKENKSCIKDCVWERSLGLRKA